MATYTSDQLQKYFKHVGLPEKYHFSSPTLEFLTELVKRQLSTVPFSSLSLHYSRTHLLSLEPEDLFEKVVNRCMGGYCMENNTFFGVILRSLNFKVMNAGARVSYATAGRPGPRYLGWSHMVNLVTIDGKTYLADVGFGPDGPCRPIPLNSGFEDVAVSPQRMKLEHKSIANHTDPNQRVWVYSYKRQPEDEWLDAYAFSEIEFFPEDYEVMNLHTMTSRESFFTQTVLCAKYHLSSEKDDLDGTISLYKDEVKKKIHGEVVESEKFENEEERILGIKKWFGIQFTDEEKRGIRFLGSELI